MKSHLKYRLKNINRGIATKIDDFFGNPLILDYQKTLFKLSLVLLCAVLIVIRGSTAPLVSDSAILYFLFYSDPNGDKTLYNIGISIIAAFIFYVFQVFIPESKKWKRDCSSFSEALRHEIFLLNQYTLAWKEFLGKEEGECHFFQFSYDLSPRGEYALTKLSYQETIEDLTENLERIANNPAFEGCDMAFRLFITRSYSVILGKLKYMDDQFPRWSDEVLRAEDYKIIQANIMDEMKRIQRRMSSIEKYKLNATEIRPYTGKSLLERLEEDQKASKQSANQETE